jgi:hypothetical protein
VGPYTDARASGRILLRLPQYEAITADAGTLFR